MNCLEVMSKWLPCRAKTLACLPSCFPALAASGGSFGVRRPRFPQRERESGYELSRPIVPLRCFFKGNAPGSDFLVPSKGSRFWLITGLDVDPVLRSVISSSKLQFLALMETHCLCVCAWLRLWSQHGRSPIPFLNK